MGAHTHDPLQDERMERWSASRMLKHLRDAHGMTPPMSWDIGQMHQAHLLDHIKAQPPEVQAEVAERDKDICGAWYGTGHNGAARCHRPVNHPEISEDGIGHSPAPIAIQPKAEEAPMPDQTPDETPERSVMAYPGKHVPALVSHALRPATDYRTDTYVSGDTTVSKPAYQQLCNGKPIWLSDREIARTTPDEFQAWRTGCEGCKDRLRPPTTTLPPNPDDEDLAEAEVQADGERRIKVDRLICAMAGISFDTVWVLDESLSLRGAMRRQLEHEASVLLAWLERGGVQYVWSDSQELAELRAKLAEAVSERAEMKQSLEASKAGQREQQRALEEMAGARAEAESLISDLEEINNGLRQEMSTLRQSLEARDSLLAASTTEQERLRRQFQSVVAERDRVREARVEVENQLADTEETLLNVRRTAENRQAELDTQLSLLSGDLEEITRERDDAREQLAAAARSYEAMKARRNEALEVLGETAGERDRAQQRLMQLLTARGNLRVLVEELKRDGWNASSVFQRMSQILAEMDTVSDEAEPVSTALEAEKEADQLAALSEGYLLDDISWARRFAEGGEV